MRDRILQSKGQARHWNLFLFSTTTIDSETARKVTFHDQVRVKSVTYDGDVYDPSGVLSGGSAPESKNLLFKMNRYSSLKKEFAERESHFVQLKLELESMDQSRSAFDKIGQEIALKDHEFKLAEERMRASSQTQVISKFPLISYWGFRHYGELGSNTTALKDVWCDIRWCILCFSNLSFLFNF